MAQSLSAILNRIPELLASLLRGWERVQGELRSARVVSRDHDVSKSEEALPERLKYRHILDAIQLHFVGALRKNTLSNADAL